MQSLGIKELNDLYREAENVDQELFAEQRSNILLVSGDHYTRKNSRFWNRIRDNRELTNEQKLRITKNHTQKIIKTYVNNIMTYVPSTGFSPKNESELSDQKAAELCQSMWVDYKERTKFRQRVRELCFDFCSIGEVAAKISFDPMAGAFKGYQASIDPITGQPVLDENGYLTHDGKPLFTGEAIIERLYGFNLLRHPDAKSMYEPLPKVIRKMVDVKEALAKLPDTDEFKQRRNWVSNSGKDETFKIFDTYSGNYTEVKNQVLFREFYYPPCITYPLGYYFITVKEGVIFEGEIPKGIYPIVFAGFDEIPTTPRGRSIIKQIRPYQAEINRAGSKIAEHQITLGDDKILYQSGSKLTQGGVLPGVRGLQFSGSMPGILPGRSGDQYVPYVASQIDEMYKVANLYEDMEEKQSGQQDPYAQMFKAIRQKKKFMLYADKFEEVLCELTSKAIDLMRYYYPDDMIVPAVGKSEAINISEFKNTTPLQYIVRIDGQSEDVESKMGRQLVMNQVLQYAGSSLSPEDLGKLIRNMPFGNVGEGTSDLTMNYDVATNIILALDKGLLPQPRPYQKHEYIMQRIGARMQQGDFESLPPQIKQNYEVCMQMHEQTKTVELQKIKQAQSEFIPTGGYLVACDFYVTDPARPGRTTRARVPYESISWLMQQLESQGTSLSSLQQMDQEMQAQIADQLLSAGQSQQTGSAFPTNLEGAPPLTNRVQ